MGGLTLFTWEVVDSRLALFGVLGTTGSSREQCAHCLRFGGPMDQTIVG